jgi:hypothetical protein
MSNSTAVTELVAVEERGDAGFAAKQLDRFGVVALLLRQDLDRIDLVRIKAARGFVDPSHAAFPGDGVKHERTEMAGDQAGSRTAGALLPVQPIDSFLVRNVGSASGALQHRVGVGMCFRPGAAAGLAEKLA